MSIKSPVFSLAMVLAWCGVAKPVSSETWQVYFGTGGPGAKGIYRATFDTETRQLTPANLDAPLIPRTAAMTV